jgi:surface polysaccharide O-acyltransferase-like enzyme
MGKKSITIATKKPSRLLWADLVRILAIYLVVHLHTLFLPSPLDKISVPLFVMLSGAMLLRKDEPYAVFFKKRCLKVLIPWIVWTIVYMFFFLFFAQDQQTVRATYFNSNLSHATLQQWGHYFVKMFFSALWFLPMIFSLYILTPVFRKVISHTVKFDMYYILILWFVFFSLLPSVIPGPQFPIYEPNLFFTAFQYSGYFLLGSFILTIKPMKKFIIASIILLLVAAIFMNDSKVGFVHPSTVFATTTTFYLFYAASSSIEKHVNAILKNIIILLSKASFGVYVLHGIVIGIWGVHIVPFIHRANFEFFYAPVVFFASAFIIMLLQRIPVLKYIVP